MIGYDAFDYWTTRSHSPLSPRYRFCGIITTMVVNIPTSGDILGLTDYEHRAYCALLAEPGSTAYRIGRASGVPLSKVYDVMDRLVAKGAAQVSSAKPARYRPTPPDEMVRRAREEIEGRLSATGATLSALYKAEPAPQDESIEGADPLAASIRSGVTLAESVVRCVCGIAAEPFVRQALPSRSSARVSLVALSPSLLPADAFLVVIDDRSVIIGSMQPAHLGLATHRPAAIAIGQALFALAPNAPGTRAVTLQSVQLPSGAGEWLGFEEAKHRRLLRPH